MSLMLEVPPFEGGAAGGEGVWPSMDQRAFQQELLSPKPRQKRKRKQTDNLQNANGKDKGEVEVEVEVEVNGVLDDVVPSSGKSKRRKQKGRETEAPPAADGMGTSNESTAKGKGKQRKKDVKHAAHKNEPAPSVQAKVSTSDKERSVEEQLGARVRKSQRRRLQRQRAAMRTATAVVAPQTDANVAETEDEPLPAGTSLPSKAKGSSKSQKTTLLDKMRAKLSGGQFRWLNELLYTRSGEDALQAFKEDPSQFAQASHIVASFLGRQYHDGYQQQVNSWPVNPLDVIIQWVKQKPASLVIGDFGCGEAKLAASAPNKVYSMDLVAYNPAVTACNIADTPLQPSAVDVAVFCLSLMGTDYGTFLQEAHRVLKPRGWLLVAEVRSRFEGDNCKEQFLKALGALNFELISEDATNKMFILFVLRKKKQAHAPACPVWPALKPCIYKRR
eukprot:jgi/Chlat1/7111/Chrsp57S06738